MKSALRISTVLVLLACLGSPIHADERRDRHERHDRNERRDLDRHRDVYRSPHWVFDDHHRHAHYYPTPGYTVSVLPAGYVSASVGNGRFFFHSGVWYQPTRRGYAVIRPPLGIVVPILPPSYATLWAGGAAYYYANEVYYSPAPGGYAVVPAPADAVEATPSAPPPPAPSTATQAATSWYWCESSRAYYPYVAECKEGWVPVPATPKGAP